MAVTVWTLGRLHAELDGQLTFLEQERSMRLKSYSWMRLSEGFAEPNYR